MSLAEAVHPDKMEYSRQYPFSLTLHFYVYEQSGIGHKEHCRDSHRHRLLTDHDRQFRGSKLVSSYVHLSVMTRRHDPQRLVAARAMGPGDWPGRGPLGVWSANEKTANPKNLSR